MRWFSGLAVLAPALSPVPAFACTLCDSPQAATLRARLLQPDLPTTLGAVILPVLLLGGIVARIAVGPADRHGAA